MARARKTKSKPARKRATKRRKVAVQQSQSGWQIGAGIFALAVLIGAGAYMVAMNDNARTSVASVVERFEVPQAVKDLPDKVRKNLPDLSSLSNPSSMEGQTESAPAQ